MDGDAQNMRTVEAVFNDFKGRRTAIIKALTREFEVFRRAFRPGEHTEDLRLFGFPDGHWEVQSELVALAELPVPRSGYNFSRDNNIRRVWSSLIAADSDAWLISVAFFYGTKAGFDKANRLRLFDMINALPTVLDIVIYAAHIREKGKKSSLPGPPSGNKSKSDSKTGSEPEQAKDRGKRVLEVEAKDSSKRVLGVEAKDRGKRVLEVEAKDMGKRVLEVEAKDSSKRVLGVEAKDRGKRVLELEAKDSSKRVLGVEAKDIGKRALEVKAKDSGKRVLEVETKDRGKRVLEVKAKDIGKRILEVETKDRGKRVLEVEAKDSGKRVLEVEAKDRGKQVLEVEAKVEAKDRGKQVLEVEAKDRGKQVLEEEDNEENSLCGQCGQKQYASNDAAAFDLDFWIACDECKKWYHGKCVHITEEESYLFRYYKCPNCSKKRSRRL